MRHLTKKQQNNFGDDIALTALNRLCPMRQDEKEFFNGHCRQRNSGRSGVRKDKDITSEAIVTTGFLRNESHGKLSTGLGSKSNTRSQVVCAAALHEEQDIKIPELWRTKSRMKIIKRMLDETPMYARDDDNCSVPLKVFNQRCHFRYGEGPEESTRLMVAMCELLGTDALGLLEAFELMMPRLDLDSLRAMLPEDTEWPVHMVLGDSFAANKLAWEISVVLLPMWLHILKACDAHLANLIVARPFDAVGLVAPAYAFAKQVRMKATKRRLRDRMLKLIRDEVPDNITIGPPANTAKNCSRLCWNHVFADATMG